jgi:uncharacterized YigZ family protein
MSVGYSIPLATVRTEITVMKSRFIATAGQASTVVAAREFIANIRREMPEASHHVYAFRVGYGGSVTDGVSDDGEPSGTAGPPILAVLRGTAVGDIVLVVTRYFGGTKLGTGGLVRAYSDAAKTVLKQLPIEMKIAKTHLYLETPYTFYDAIRQTIQQHDGEIVAEDFTDKVTVKFVVPAGAAEALTRQITDLSVGQVLTRSIEG